MAATDSLVCKRRQSQRCQVRSLAAQPESDLHGDKQACFDGAANRHNHHHQEIRSGGDGQFSFTGDLSSGFTSLTTQSGTMSTGKFTKNVGTYSVTEVVPAGWELASVACTGDVGQYNLSTTDLNSKSATIRLDANEDITCTFTNKKHGSIKIIKDTGGVSSPGFPFTISNATPGSFSLAGGQSTNFSDLAAGSYTVQEQQLRAVGPSKRCNARAAARQSTARKRRLHSVTGIT